MFLVSSIVSLVSHLSLACFAFFVCLASLAPLYRDRQRCDGRSVPIIIFTSSLNILRLALTSRRMTYVQLDLELHSWQVKSVGNLDRCLFDTSLVSAPSLSSPSSLVAVCGINAFLVAESWLVKK